ncbi:unnamed protein product [Amoebophrya sp. A25]|nr:unnamed protein product [Amoebophrya sp. A25]|eukprot:GSA25T00027304001.1
MTLKSLCVIALGSYAVAEGAKPVVELSIASASTPFPAVSDAIASAESSRAAALRQASAEVDQAYKETLAQASVTLGNTIAKALGRTSFANIAEPTISVSLAKSASDEAAGASAVKSVEGKRAGAAAALVASAKKEFQEVAKVVIAEFDRQVKGKASFLRFSREINVRAVADPSYATISGLIQGMESRRDSEEARLRSQILLRELDLVRALNRVGASALSK